MQTETVKTFDRIESHRKAIVAGDAPVHPGQPQTTDGLSANDVVAQGDLYIRVRGADEKIPAGYEKAVRRQLVPGNEDGRSTSCRGSTGSRRGSRRTGRRTSIRSSDRSSWSATRTARSSTRVVADTAR
jgi:hypothetical protein